MDAAAARKRYRGEGLISFDIRERLYCVVPLGGSDSTGPLAGRHLIHTFLNSRPSLSSFFSSFNIVGRLSHGQALAAKLLAVLTRGLVCLQ